MKILPLYFFVTLLIGFFVVYISQPKPDIILKMPNPRNCNDITYIDDNDICYKYAPVELDCDLCHNNIYNF